MEETKQHMGLSINDFLTKIRREIIDKHFGELISPGVIEGEIERLAKDHNIHLRSKPSIEKLHDRLTITLNLDMERIYIEIHPKETHRSIILRTNHVI